ncbi:class I SAM-dependent methyltransferase [Rugosimonospora acidiphila]|uniref:class I SAM-dependent methyltransferase n=1 Tax=Rugosimonospora acidiphila TaxID=556531 RepID=UPI0031EA7B15
MDPYIANPLAWQESWDRQQEAYLPDREHRIASMLDAVDAVVGDDAAPRVLDLAGGTGSISLRTLARFPSARMTLVDLDPALLAIAAASLGDRATIVTADLRRPDWRADLAPGTYDAVLTATALHWLPANRVADLYAEIHELLRPGGVFVNADHMPDDGLPGLSKRLVERADRRREQRYAAGVVLSWSAWWEHVAGDPALAPLVRRRFEIFPAGPHTEWTPPISWHVDTLRSAGFTEVGPLWRGGADAAVAGVC